MPRIRERQRPDRWRSSDVPLLISRASRVASRRARRTRPCDRPGDDGDDVHRLRRGAPPPRTRLCGGAAALSPSGLGRARPGGDLGLRARRRRGGAWQRGRPGRRSRHDRDHEPARDHGALAALDGALGAPGDRLAGPADCRALPGAPAGPHPRAHRSRPGSLFLGYEARVAPPRGGRRPGRARLRHRRLLARLATDRRRGSRHRRLERLAHDAPRAREPRVGG